MMPAGFDCYATTTGGFTWFCCFVFVESGTEFMFETGFLEIKDAGALLLVYF